MSGWEKPDWQCKFCAGRDGKQFINFGHRKSCFKCRIEKGACFGKRVEKPPPKSKPSLAERQILGQKKDEALKKQNENLKKENARLKKAAAGSAPGSDSATPAASEQGSSGTQMDAAEPRPAFDKKMLQERVRFYESAGQKDGPDAKELLAAAKEKLAQLQRAELDSKPVDEQVKRARRSVEACSRIKEKAEKEKNELAEKIKELQEKSGEAQARIDKATEELDAAKQNLELVLKKHLDAAPAVNAAADAAGDAAKMFAAMHDMVQLLAAKKGVRPDDPATSLFVGQLREMQQHWGIVQAPSRPVQLSSERGEEQQNLQDRQPPLLQNAASLRAKSEQQQGHVHPQLPTDQAASTGVLGVPGSTGECDIWMEHVAALAGGSVDDLSDEQRSAAAAMAKLQPPDQESIAKRLKVQ